MVACACCPAQKPCLAVEYVLCTDAPCMPRFSLWLRWLAHAQALEAGSLILVQVWSTAQPHWFIQE